MKQCVQRQGGGWGADRTQPAAATELIQSFQWEV